jgi:5-methylcytosine-specific restriction endonuclease McrA
VVSENKKSDSAKGLLRAQEVRTRQESRYIPAALKRQVWARDKSRCTHPGCNSEYFLETDHIVPLALGGKTELDNLRLLCRTHNLWAAIDKLGIERMDKFMNRLKAQGF